MQLCKPARQVLAKLLLSVLTVQIAGFCLVGFIGCNRAAHFRRADRDTYGIIHEKGTGPNWQVPPDFTIQPDSRSRFLDRTCVVDPALPVPAPQLYAYSIPLLATPAAPPRDLANEGDDVPQDVKSPEAVPADSLPPESNILEPAGSDSLPEPAAGRRVRQHPTFGAAARQNQALIPEHSAFEPGTLAPKYQMQALGPLPGSSADRTPSPLNPSAVVSASANSLPIVAALPLRPGEESGEEGGQTPEPVAATELLDSFGTEFVIRIPPVPTEAWQSLPDACLQRMLEFATVRTEFEKTFGQAVTEAQLDSAQRVTLENVLEIALINSREYQLRKEALYRTALALSLQRFDFDLQFTRGGRRTASPNYVHNRNAGIEVNRFAIPTGTGLTRSLYTAGQLLARFSNDVLLTFNGPTGYSPQIGSDILIELTQPLIQRDIQFEPLTQAERDVVYAARSFVQFRKQLFRDLAERYYNLLLTYRSIAINTQDYFSNLAGFNRSAANYQADRIPRFQVDQFEQNVLRSRGQLIDSCNTLERSLDQLKLRIGLPPELPLNVDLSELETLTLSDEATVIGEQILRARIYVRQQLENADSSVALPAAAELARRLLSLIENRQTRDQAQQAEVEQLRLLVAILEAEDKRLEVKSNASVLQQESRGATTALPAQVFLRKKAVLEATLEAIQRELRILRMLEDSQEPSLDSISDDVAILAGRWQAGVQAFRGLSEEQLALSYEEQAQQLPRLIQRAQEQQESAAELEKLVQHQLALRDIELQDTEEDYLALVETIVDLSETPGFAQSSGLTKLDVDVDEAMLTALVQRLDLMNQRGDVADAWRQIKLRGDSLRSILNVRAAQSIRTRTGSKNPFEFSFDDSTTELSLEFDTPLNRRVERNNFRAALINYQLALRNLIEAEDNIKFDIRNDLREIELDQNQYQIAIASAALAYERVASTRLQLATGQGNITARDFLEAQQAYTQSLSDVARQHIGYILDRIQFFLDLEQLQVDPVLFWPELRNESYPFLPNTDFASTSPDAYGRLPCGPWFSKCMQRMNCVPPGQAYIHRQAGGEPSFEPSSELSTEEGSSEATVPGPEVLNEVP